MTLAVLGSACLLLVGSFLGADGPKLSNPTLKPPGPLVANPTPSPVAASPSPKQAKHYLVQIKLIEVDDQGRETVLGEPQLQTTGGNAGISVDHPDGRRFEFTMRLTDRLSAPDELMPAKTPAISAQEDLTKKLEQKLELNVQQQSRKDVLREIASRTGINIVIEPESGRSAASALDAPVTLAARDEAVADTLDRLLQHSKLGFMVKHEIVLIATPDRLAPAPEDLIVKTYIVGDLVPSSETTNSFDPLIERIKTTIQPASWDRKEAPATIRPFNSTQSLVVRQTVHAHASIERLLDKIRREQPKRIADEK